MSRATNPELVLAGDMADWDVSALMTALGLGRQALRLEVTNADGRCEGSIITKAGRVVAARAGDCHGADAVQRLLALTAPARFRVLRDELHAVPTDLTDEPLEHPETTASRPPTGVFRKPAAPVPFPIIEGSLGAGGIARVMRAAALCRQYAEIHIYDEHDGHAGVIHIKAGHILWAQAGAVVDKQALRELWLAPPSFRFAVFRQSHPVVRQQPLARMSEVLRGLDRAHEPERAPQAPANTAFEANSRATPPLARARSARSAQSAQSASSNASAQPARRLLAQGSCSEVALHSLIEALSTGRQHLELQLFDRAGATLGTLELKAGMLVAARMGDAHGVDAARGLLRSTLAQRFAVARLAPRAKTLTALTRVTELLPERQKQQEQQDEAAAHPYRVDDEDTITLTSDVEDLLVDMPPTPVAHEVRPVRESRVLDGSLTDFELSSVLQVAGMSRQHTTVCIFDDRREQIGEVRVKGGQLLGARAHGATGVAALRLLLHSPQDFSFSVLRQPRADSDARSLGVIDDVLRAAARTTYSGSASPLPPSPLPPSPLPPSPLQVPSPWSGDWHASYADSQLLHLSQHTGLAQPAHSQPSKRRPLAGEWVGGAAFGAAFVLLGGVGAALLMRQPQGATEVASQAAYRPPAELLASPEAPRATAQSGTTGVEAAASSAPGSAPAALGSVFESAPLAASQLSRPAIASMQAALKHLGYDPGPIDGVVGPRTSGAVEAFQRAERLAADGKLTVDTRRKLAARLSSR